VRPEALRFVERTCPDARLTEIAGDASTRSFYRAHLPDGTTRVVMDYGRPFTGEPDDVRLTRVFTEARLPVAAVHDLDGAAGCLLLEDLGERTLESTLIDETGRRNAAARPLLEQAVRLARSIAVHGTAALRKHDQGRGPALDAERFTFEMEFFLEHYVRGLLRRRDPFTGLRRQLVGLAVEAARTPRRVLCHRDFHSRNLIVRPDGSLAMVDIQDARWGPLTYDLASLLRDAYMRIDDATVGPLVGLYRRLIPDTPRPEAFRRRFHLVSAQRMIKALGTFGYQAKVRGERRYLESVPRTLARLRRILPARECTRDLYLELSRFGLLTPPPGL